MAVYKGVATKINVDLNDSSQIIINGKKYYKYFNI